jgi:formylglycine-generating enzyme required for sulfatase activity
MNKCMFVIIVLVSSVNLHADDNSILREFTNSAGMKMKRIDAKPFMTGTMYNQSNQHWYEFIWEEPRYVKNLNTFYTSEYEVTNLQYRQFLRETNRPAPKGLLLQKMEMINDFEPLKSPGFNGDNQPIVCVTAEDAEGFCKWLSEKEGKSYRLPSNDEWEFACRADTSTSYNWGSEQASIEMANYDPFLVEDSFDGKIATFSIQQAAKLRGGKVKWNAGEKQISGSIQGKDFQVTVGQSQAVVNGETITMEATAELQGDEVMVPVKFLAFDLSLIFTGAPMPVGSFKPNAWGLYDMHGNVNEITSSSHARRFRKVRGGAWNDSARRCRSASVRERWQVRAGMAGVGFRVVCDVPPPNQLEVKVGDPIIVKTLENREGFWSPKLLLLRDNTLIVRDRMSKDFGKTWSDCPLQPYQNVIELSDKTIISIPPSMGRDKSTPPGFGKATGLRSTDGWKTTESFEVTFYSPNSTGGFNDIGDYKDFLGHADHDILEMPDGTLLMSVYGFFSNKRTLSDYQRYPIETQQWSYVGWIAESKDKGKTWKYLSTAVHHPQMTRAGGCEIGMVSLANGDLLLGARPGESGYPNEKMLFVSSEDNGKTWNNARYCYADGIAVTGVYPQFVLMKNGMLAMAWERTGRHTTSIAFSLDGRGENWCHRTKLPVAKNGYNDIVEIKPGELLVLGAGKTDGKNDVRIIPVSVRKKSTEHSSPKPATR